MLAVLKKILVCAFIVNKPLQVIMVLGTLLNQQQLPPGRTAAPPVLL